jgi:hypothetical protein
MEQQQATTPPDVAPEPSLDDKILGHFGYGDTEAPTQEPSAQPAPDSEQTDEEVVIPDEEVISSEPTSFELEIKHNGETKKLTSKEEAVRLAQMGTDYEFKMARVREDAQRVQTMAQAAQARYAMQAQALDALAEAKSYERQLKPYANVDWAQAAQADPQAAFQARMQYDALVGGYNQAIQRARELEQPMAHAQQAIDHNQMALEMQKLTERIPEWKDSAKKDQDAKAIIDTMVKGYGFQPQELGGPILNDHRVISILRDAWKYREALQAKAKKGPPQGLPQVAKPGATVPPKSAAQKTGDYKRALHQPNISSAQRKAVQEAWIAQKFGLKD